MTVRCPPAISVPLCDQALTRFGCWPSDPWTRPSIKLANSEPDESRRRVQMTPARAPLERRHSVTAR